MTSHRITLLPSGHAFDVPEGKRILDSGLAADVSMPYGCRIGMCRSCRGRIVEGAVDYGDVHPSYLTDRDKAAGFALLCAAKPLSDVVVEVDELPALEPPREYISIIKRIAKPTPEIAIVDLRLPLHQPMRFAAGQYIDILLDGGIRRSYSIASATSVAGVIDIQLHIKRVRGGVFTDQLFERLQVRDKLRFEGPRGTFFLRRDSERPLIFIAAGTGYAPIRSILAQALTTTRPIALYWGASRKRDLYALDEPQRWAELHPNFTFVPVLGEPIAEQPWVGRTGFVHHAVVADFSDLSNHDVYASGSPRMIDAARSDLVTRSLLPAAQFFSDAFIDMSYAQPESVPTTKEIRDASR